MEGLKRFDEAAKHYRQSLFLNPSSPEAWTALGAVAEKLGAVEDAVQHYRTALTFQITPSPVLLKKLEFLASGPSPVTPPQAQAQSPTSSAAQSFPSLPAPASQPPPSKKPRIDFHSFDGPFTLQKARPAPHLRPIAPKRPASAPLNPTSSDNGTPKTPAPHKLAPVQHKTPRDPAALICKLHY